MVVDAAVGVAQPGNRATIATKWILEVVPVIEQGDWTAGGRS